MGVKVRGTPLSVSCSSQKAGEAEDGRERTEQEELAAELQWGLTPRISIAMLARDLGVRAPCYCVQQPRHDWIMASVDGEAPKAGAASKIVEMKAHPGEGDWRDSGRPRFNAPLLR